MITKCKAVWHKADFGMSLDKECHGCARMHQIHTPLPDKIKPPPYFSDKCPLREEKK